MRIQLNGEPRDIPADASLPRLLELLALPAPTALIEHNGRALLRSEWPDVYLTDGDRLEILRIVAGG